VVGGQLLNTFFFYVCGQVGGHLLCTGRWAGGSAPLLTSSGTDVLAFYTYDNGTTYLGFTTGKNLS
jgi:hypothetical protein